MPELPEVETLKIGLQEHVVGKKIAGVEVIDPKLLTGDVNDVIGATFTNVRRMAKGIVLDLDNKYSIAVHIKLTGQLIFRDAQTKDMLVEKPTPSLVPNKFTRIVFRLEENTKVAKESNLYFQEVRGFAWMKILPTDQVGELPFFKNLGPEPIPSPGTETTQLTEEMLSEMASKSRLPIKVLIMDQKRIGGIGNIYANDALFDSGIDPRRNSNTISQAEIKKLYKSILKVLEMGLKYHGSSELNYVNVLGKSGEYQKHARIYGRKNMPCLNCGGDVQKTYIAGRGTFFCSNCQK